MSTEVLSDINKSRELSKEASSIEETVTTFRLYKKVLSDNSIVTSGYGLYNMDNAKVFRGEDVNNYVKLENSLWRIVKVNSDNTLMLIHNEGLHYNQAWDDRYNEAKLYNIGNNQYISIYVQLLSPLY